MSEDILHSELKPLRPSKRGRNAVIFACVALVWLVLDQLTKLYFNSFVEGEFWAPFLPNVIDFCLVHNMGAAWGAFSDMTFFLAALSVVICIVILIYLFLISPDSSVLAAVSLGLVFAGGIGNLIDRLTNGYVIDFIEFAFFDFPVFNIADIGVTCGVALFFISMILEWRSELKDESTEEKGSVS